MPSSRAAILTPSPKISLRFDDYIADVDAHTKNKASVFRITDCKFANAVLEMRSSSNRLDRARKLSQEPVASVLDNAASVLRDCRLDNVRQERASTGADRQRRSDCWHPQPQRPQDGQRQSLDPRVRHINALELPHPGVQARRGRDRTLAQPRQRRKAPEDRAQDAPAGR